MCELTAQISLLLRGSMGVMQATKHVERFQTPNSSMQGPQQAKRCLNSNDSNDIQNSHSSNDGKDSDSCEKHQALLICQAGEDMITQLFQQIRHLCRCLSWCGKEKLEYRMTSKSCRTQLACELLSLLHTACNECSDLT